MGSVGDPPPHRNCGTSMPRAIGFPAGHIRDSWHSFGLKSVRPFAYPRSQEGKNSTILYKPLFFHPRSPPPPHECITVTCDPPPFTCFPPLSVQVSSIQYNVQSTFPLSSLAHSASLYLYPLRGSVSRRALFLYMLSLVPVVTPLDFSFPRLGAFILYIISFCLPALAHLKLLCTIRDDPRILPLVYTTHFSSFLLPTFPVHSFLISKGTKSEGEIYRIHISLTIPRVHRLQSKNSERPVSLLPRLPHSLMGVINSALLVLSQLRSMHPPPGFCAFPKQHTLLPGKSDVFCKAGTTGTGSYLLGNTLYTPGFPRAPLFPSGPKKRKKDDDS